MQISPSNTPLQIHLLMGIFMVATSSSGVFVLPKLLYSQRGMSGLQTSSRFAFKLEQNICQFSPHPTLAAPQPPQDPSSPGLCAACSCTSLPLFPHISQMFPHLHGCDYFPGLLSIPALLPCHFWLPLAFNKLQHNVNQMAVHSPKCLGPCSPSTTNVFPEPYASPSCYILMLQLHNISPTPYSCVSQSLACTSNPIKLNGLVA